MTAGLLYYFFLRLLQRLKTCPHPTKKWIHNGSILKLMKSIWLLSDTYVRSSRPYGENFDRHCVALFIHMYDGHGSPIDDSESGAMRKVIDSRLMYPGLSCGVFVFLEAETGACLTSPAKCIQDHWGFQTRSVRQKQTAIYLDIQK